MYSNTSANSSGYASNISTLSNSNINRSSNSSRLNQNTSSTTNNSRTYNTSSSNNSKYSYEQFYYLSSLFTNKKINNSKTPDGQQAKNQNQMFLNNITNQFTYENDTNPTVCYCSKPAKQFTVRKEGPNMGRMFYTCPDNKTCDFFQWADGDSGANGGNGGIGGNGGDGGNGGNDGNIGNGEKIRGFSGAQSSSNNGSYRNNDMMNTNSFSNGKRLCECQKPALLLTVRKDGPNQGRKFFKCDDPNGCKFFEWEDNQGLNLCYQTSLIFLI